MKGLTAFDYEVMDALMDGPASQATLALYLSKRPTTVGLALRKLVDQGYVLRHEVQNGGFCKAWAMYHLARTRKAA